jgi:phage terminase small subunit
MQAFCDHYLLTNDGPKSMQAAGYNITPYNARIQAQALLRHPEVIAYITHNQEVQLIRKQATADAIIDELSKIAFSDIRDVVEWGPNGITLKPSNSLDSDASAAIAEISESKAGAPAKIRLHDKMNALAQLSRILGLNNDKVHVTHDVAGLSDAELVRKNCRGI